MTRRGRGPLRPGAKVLFESWRGRYADSPRAVSEEITRRGLDVRQVWVADPGTSVYGSHSTSVRRTSPGHLRALATADLIVSNDLMPRWFRTRSRTTYVQTWHGTPLKRIGFDIATVGFDDGDGYLRHLARDVSSWDLLLSSSPFATGAFRTAFGYDGEVLEAGQPRNDVLLAPDREQRAAAVRQRLGLSTQQRVLLYAPTWRDDTQDAEGRRTQEQRLDLALLLERLGADDRLLLRLHRNVATRWAVPAGDDRVRDVTDVQDMADLLLVTDVLVTDYSSVMFDFAVTGRPMVFFCYDLDHYRDQLRGFYLDFVAEAPGPVVRTTEELAGLLAEPDAGSTRWSTTYRRFVDRYCCADDGRAAQRLVDRLLSD